MKRVIIALALTVLVLGAAVGEFIYVGSQADGFTGRIETIDRLTGEKELEKAAALCRDTEREWDGEVGKIYILLIHDYADNIGSAIGKMCSHLENGNIDMYFAESTGAKKALASIKGSEYPNLENIL